MLFLNMFTFLNSSSSLDLIILTQLLGRFVLMKQIPGEHFLSDNSGETLYAASCTESWRELINEYAIFLIASRTFFPLQPVSMILTLHFQTLESKLSCKLVP